MLDTRDELKNLVERQQQLDLQFNASIEAAKQIPSEFQSRTSQILDNDIAPQYSPSLSRSSHPRGSGFEREMAPGMDMDMDMYPNSPELLQSQLDELKSREQGLSAKLVESQTAFSSFEAKWAEVEAESNRAIDAVVRVEAEEQDRRWLTRSQRIRSEHEQREITRTEIIELAGTPSFRRQALRDTQALEPRALDMTAPLTMGAQEEVTQEESLSDPGVGTHVGTHVPEHYEASPPPPAIPDVRPPSPDVRDPSPEPEEMAPQAHPMSPFFPPAPAPVTVTEPEPEPEPVEVAMEPVEPVEAFDPLEPSSEPPVPPMPETKPHQEDMTIPEESPVAHTLAGGINCHRLSHDFQKVLPRHCWIEQGAQGWSLRWSKTEARSSPHGERFTPHPNFMLSGRWNLFAAQPWGKQTGLLAALDLDRCVWVKCAGRGVMLLLEDPKQACAVADELMALL
eukprot:gnl/Dysnectes_brevis/3688_a4714_979.p1 GENE.gnl/Dysnectes_brevis/3688_a4714_979~~gnl/Dysnectes_brevis/3688_a4714_979.p1  ORF type:complete len:490 (-),score=133.76 gnl/Dysnectes_brevis/3688_a4714_979:38-1396(-)